MRLSVCSRRWNLSLRVLWLNSSSSANVCGLLFLFEPQLTTNINEAKTPLERAKLLESTSLFKNIHAETAQAGQTAPPVDLDVDLHFTCFVEAPDAAVRTSTKGVYSTRLIELDGARDGPMDHGPANDFLKVRRIFGILTCWLTICSVLVTRMRLRCLPLPQDVAKVVKECFIDVAESLNFTVMYLGPPP